MKEYIMKSYSVLLILEDIFNMRRKLFRWVGLGWVGVGVGGEQINFDLCGVECVTDVLHVSFSGLKCVVEIMEMTMRDFL